MFRTPKNAALLLSLLLAVVSLFAGCQADTPADNATTAPTTAATAATTAAPTAAAEATEPPSLYPFAQTLSFTIMQGTHTQFPTEKSPMDEYLDQLLNTDITYLKVPSANYSEKLTAILATGELPEVIVGGDLDFLVSQEALIPLDEYLNAQTLPNAMAFLDKFKDLFNINLIPRMINATDGKIYNLPNPAGNIEAYSVGIRSDWLDRLELEAPKTLDDWVTVLTAFRDEDANGNGNAGDEIPWVGPFAMFITAYGIPLRDPTLANSRFIEQNGEYFPVYEHEHFGEALAFMAGLYADKLIDQEYLVNNQTEANFKEMWNNSLSGAGCYWSQVLIELATAAIQEVDPDGVMQGIELPVGPYGDQMYVGRDIGSGGSFRITVAAEKNGILDELLAWCDWNYSEAGFLFNNYGIEATHYEMVDGKPYYLSPYAEGWLNKRAEDIGGYWRPYYQDPEAYRQCLMGGSKTEEEMKQKAPLSALNYEALYMNSQYLYAPCRTFSTPTSVELGTSLYALLDENVDKVIMGSMTVDEFFTAYEQIKADGFADIAQEMADAYASVNQ